MGSLFLRWILLAVSVIAASYFTRALGLGFETSASTFGEFLVLMLGVAILSFLNATLGNILKLLTLPLTCLTLGLFALVINAVVLIWAASFGLGFTISEEDGFRRFLAAFLASLLISAVNAILGSMLIKDRDKDRDD